MRKALMRKSFAFAMLLAFVLWMGAGGADVCKQAAAADQMPAGLAKPVAAAGHWGAGTVNDAVWSVKTGVVKTGPLAVVTTPLLFLGQFGFRTLRSAANVATPWNANNYAMDVGQVQPEMSKVADGMTLP